ncbi:DNA-binding transcriptional regulator LsrR (DeoR family) [Rhodobacter viridis]|uniref:DNA-binding transcriptional regulator LsrR (DeoR family) n=1 Tax=Rhodobacter viridis TaxID=1054202 RepID=A0A318U0R4_9RHOB|nr:sugar-binding domain-containing protein [Rhodobacter viridis]PYF09705.1 DNA-binding transcriptional regulator LsrR (DeoR family) [Rhodobacter viridis]
MTAPPHRLPHPDTPESRARWLHDIGGLSVEEIGWRLGLPSERVQALLAQGPTEAVPHPESAEGARLIRRLSRRLREQFGLEAVSIAPMAPGDVDPVPVIAAAAARHLVRLLQARNAPAVVGLSHGRTIAAMVAQLPEMRLTGLRFVSLLGELTFAHSAYPHVVMNQIAQRLGAQAFPCPTALYAATPEEAADLLRQPMVRKVLEMAQQAEVWVVGIGRGASENQLHQSGMIDDADLSDIMARGATCEILGRFFDDEGHELPSALAARTLSPAASDFRGRRVIGLAGGVDKVTALHAALRAHLLRELVTDSRTAVALLDDDEQAEYAALLP